MFLHPFFVKGVQDAIFHRKKVDGDLYYQAPTGLLLFILKLGRFYILELCHSLPLYGKRVSTTLCLSSSTGFHGRKKIIWDY